ncbi:hypothetical protein SA19142_24750 [Staphylococcus argenteus]|uniref:Uncharacterized protein n=1 Tax=Staphylococcus argenteus TaxID=985002 RepID=A0A7U7PZ15_9STAP|nr:hypothetical protein CJ017_08925 [Staphylococcus argenteus]ATZ87585.1 hypothetical protein CKO49_08935 [Staphylococcus argenteus]KAA0801089.1 hypothetical protein DVU64_06355 [Staphylococcus argenteus]MZG25281.1 hypothetical protein [Staphylococcus argenteus]PSH06324.1 hypothetical protein CKX96_11660 [Staphylococcus argenteus]
MTCSKRFNLIIKTCYYLYVDIEANFIILTFLIGSHENYIKSITFYHQSQSVLKNSNSNKD